MKINNWLAASAAAVPERLALVSQEESLSYVELERRAADAARRFALMGIGRGNRVALVLEPSVEYVSLLHGLMKLGAIASPIDPRLPERELDARLAAIEPTLVIRELAEISDGGDADCKLDETLDLGAVHCVIHTSGTSGRAKPIELTYGNHLWSAVGSAARIGVDPDDRWLCSLPLHHISGLSILLRSAIYGTTAVLERFEPRSVSAIIGPSQITLASCVATTLARLLQAGAELDRLRCVLLGGGPLPRKLIADAIERGVPIAPTYGLTEAASQVATLPPGQAARKPGSAGPPLLPTRLRIADGMILVRGPTVSRLARDEEGWLRTGDRGQIGDDGHLYVHGRADDMIVTGGENVSPQEVEETLRLHPDVLDVAVSGREELEWQQMLVAVVVLRDGSTATGKELRKFCRCQLAPYKVPKEIKVVDRLAGTP